MVQFGADPHQRIAYFFVVAEIPIELNGSLIIHEIGFVQRYHRTYAQVFRCHQILVEKISAGCRFESKNDNQPVDIGSQRFLSAAIGGAGQQTAAVQQGGDDALALRCRLPHNPVAAYRFTDALPG